MLAKVKSWENSVEMISKSDINQWTKLIKSKDAPSKRVKSSNKSSHEGVNYVQTGKIISK